MRSSYVSVPLRGVGCFAVHLQGRNRNRVSVPLRGVGCFQAELNLGAIDTVSVPLRGVGCFWDNGAKAYGS